MPIFIESNYSKKLGLPGYSSHSYSLTIRTELGDLGQLERESSKLYAILQGSVDREIQEVGFVPEANGRATQPVRSNSDSDEWGCSIKQRDLILKIVEEHQLDPHAVDGLAKDMFRKSVRMLNKLEASGLIEELLAKYGPKKQGTNGYRQNGQKAGR